MIFLRFLSQQERKTKCLMLMKCSQVPRCCSFTLDTHHRPCRHAHLITMRLPLLTDGYQPTTFEYTKHPGAPGSTLPDVHEWIEVFRAAIPTFAKHALTDEAVPLESRQVPPKSCMSLHG